MKSEMTNIWGIIIYGKNKTNYKDIINILLPILIYNLNKLSYQKNKTKNKEFHVNSKFFRR